MTELWAQVGKLVEKADAIEHALRWFNRTDPLKHNLIFMRKGVHWDCADTEDCQESEDSELVLAAAAVVIEHLEGQLTSLELELRELLAQKESGEADDDD
jgi:hypothetical protein